MYLKKLSLTFFKNYDQAELEFSPKINCFVGNNGIGKTNILDAIHYLSLTKSFFNNIDSVNIKHNEDYFIIQGNFVRDDEENNIFCSFHKQKQKVLKRNGKEYHKLSDHVGRYPVVMISPADSALISEGSEVRRKFLNKIISQYDAGYLDSVLKYNKVLQQRNKLLKDFKTAGRFENDMLSIWDSQLIKYGNYISRERDLLVNELIPVFREYYSFISNEKELVKLNYRSHLKEGDFTQMLEDTINKDRILEYTTIGIHKDDLILEMNDFPVKSLGSQGQQKSYLVALKLAKFDYIKRRAGFSPILLLDDIFDKFDAARVEQIIRLVGNHRFGQIFITDTHKSRLHDILASVDSDYKLFNISENGFEEETGHPTYKMRRSKTISLAEAIQDYIKEMNLGTKLKEISLLDSWETIVGKGISSRTSRVYIKDKILFVHLKSSIVRNELMMIRETLREKLNNQAGEEVIKEIILK